MDLWLIIVIAAVLIVLFIATAGRSMFGGAKGEGNPNQNGEQPDNFSDDPSDPGSRR